MARDLTPEDRGKTVMNAEGHRIGTISDVQEGRGHVETDNDSEGLTDKLKSALGWDDSDDTDDTHELRNEDVDSVDDDGVHLRGA